MTFKVNPCDNHQCKRGGKCVPNNKGSYVCKCNKGTKGRYCDQGETLMLSQKMVVDDELDDPFDVASTNTGISINAFLYSF